VGAIESGEEFGRRLYAEAWRRGWARAEKRVGLGDGAEWIWNQAELHFPGAVPIVDLYQARQHLWDLSAKIYPRDSPAQRRWGMVRKDKLDDGKIETWIRLLHAAAAAHPDLAEESSTEINYFETKKRTKNACTIPSFENRGYSWAPESSRQAVKLSWDGCNGLECSGRCAELIPSSPSAVVN
jgi:hypothetical protein